MKNKSRDDNYSKYHGKREFVRDIKILKDIERCARKNMQKSKSDGVDMIEKSIIVYDSIRNLEDKIGLLIPYSEFERSAKDNFKLLNKRISKKEINKVFWKLMSAGVVFIPKEGFIENLISRKRLFHENI
ncbi:MAG: hypothetical protein Q7R87_01515 [Nanoarchaeota archaeon]|nr:hypothetical protein [Nanoarchaeota archaeon]